MYIYMYIFTLYIYIYMYIYVYIYIYIYNEAMHYCIIASTDVFTYCNKSMKLLPFQWPPFCNFMEEEFCTKFCCVLISFH